MFELFESREFFAYAVFIFAAAFVIGIFSVSRSRGNAECRRGRVAEIGLTLLAWCLLSSSLFERGMNCGHVPPRNVFEIFQVLGWFAVFFVVFLRIVWGLRVPLFFGTGSAFILCAVGFANVTSWDACVTQSAEIAEIPWLSFHVVLATIGYACFSATAMVACIYLVQNAALRRRSVHPFFSRLPDLSSLDRIAGRLCAAGLIFLGLGSTVGIAVFFRGGEAVSLVMLYKIFLSVGVFSGFLTLLLVRRKIGISALKFARATLVLFAVSVIFLGGIACLRSVQAKGAGTPEPVEEGTTR